MSVTATAPMIQRQIDDGICLLTFDRPESGANIFDAATLADLDQQLDFVEQEDSLEGVVIASAKKSIFIAGADLKTFSGDKAVALRRTVTFLMRAASFMVAWAAQSGVAEFDTNTLTNSRTGSNRPHQMA